MTRPDPLPQIVGYDVLEVIDVGGFSRVYRAIQRRFDRAVAVKVLNAGFTDERQRRAFERECRVMGQLSSHPNIVTVYDSATTESGLPAIVMELYTGTYRTAGRLSVPEVVDVGRKIADALDHIHRQGIVHRDLKPHNLFISQHGEPAIADFGISTMGGEHTSGARFTLKYAPPELLREGVSDAAGDVYSLGVTLYQLASGRVPFEGPDEAAVVRQVMVADPAPLARSDAPVELERVIARCLAKQPGGRPTASELADAFRHIQEDVGTPGRRPTPTAGRQPPADGTVGRSLPPTPDDGTTDRETGSPVEPPDGTDDAVARPTPGRRTAQPIPTHPVAAPAPPRARRNLLLAAGVVVMAIGAAAVAIAVSSGDDDATTSTTTARPVDTAPPFEVLVPPTDLAVTTTAEGFEFTWTPGHPGGKVQLHRIGSDDTVIADEQPFVWRLAAAPGGNCFEARAVDAAGTRLSQAATTPICADAS